MAKSIAMAERQANGKLFCHGDPAFGPFVLPGSQAYHRLHAALRSEHPEKTMEAASCVLGYDGHHLVPIPQGLAPVPPSESGKFFSLLRPRVAVDLTMREVCGRVCWQSYVMMSQGQSCTH